MYSTKHLKIVASLLLAMVIACNPKSKEDDIRIHGIIVKLGSSYQYDLGKETYTVYFFNGKSHDYRFTLSNKEKKSIEAMAKKYGIGKLTGDVRVEDKCDMFPKVMTVMSFKAGDNNVKVTIDEFCDKHSIFKKGETQNVLDFLHMLNKIVRSKPEVANAPQTDIKYM